MNRDISRILLLHSVLLCLLLWILPLQAAQICNSSMLPSTPDSHYQNNDDGTVTALHTGLMWQKCSLGQSGADCSVGAAQTFSWDLALQYPATLNVGGGYAGYTDWRLPNVKELMSLVELSCYNPSINLTFFPNTPDGIGSIYWTSSPHSNFLKGSWYVYFHDGYTNENLRTSTFHVRLVRDAP